MSASAEPAVLEGDLPKRSAARFARPLLGLLLPVGLAVFWEVAVRMGLSSGRLVPPPSVIFRTFAELWETGELQTHALATMTRVAAGFAGGVFALGILVFSGSLYLLSVTGLRWLGAITPIGGVLFLSGWASLAWAIGTSARPAADPGR